MNGVRDLEGLRSIIRTHPIIDNHAHNLLSAGKVLDYENYPLESITSEAQGKALEQASYTLSHRLGVKQLATLFDCEPKWETIKTARRHRVKTDYKGLVRDCLSGTSALLLDDLVANRDIEDYTWHDQFLTSVAGTRRIVRIEVVASQILRRMNLESATITDFLCRFRERILEECRHPMVAGFKSIICYRTGLDVQVQEDDDTLEICQDSLTYILEHEPSFRIAQKPLNDLILREALRTIRNAAAQNICKSKPIQFHTGLGDNDIDLVLANPAYLQPLIEHFHDVNFVLLHSSYPYTREAGYIASVYPNVYLDLGEVYSMVSKDAELSILRQSMELTPTSRLLWSTDGHFHPETYWLSNTQFREALETVSHRSPWGIYAHFFQEGTLTILNDSRFSSIM